ncbi:MAG: hypothetical protein KKF48_04055 [Nanoarchaeota archaeon]|nr:hypothetical protein [Nanoarchaeota archaeon]MBU1028192.1 hypothetical protein [Nanoarchaeota archaeon]
MNIKLNKKGADKIISVYWFAILILVAGGVFMMVSTFYNSPYDVRGLEAEILSDKVADCISNQGQLNFNLIEEDGKFSEAFKNNFLNNCKIILNENKPEYYFEVNFYGVDDTSNSVFDISYGNQNWKAGCSIQEDKEHEKLSKCLEKRFYAVGEDNVQYLIKVLSIVGKAEKNVR